MQLKHVDEQIKPAISEALKKKNGLFLTHLNSEAGAANIPGKLSSMLLHHDHLCGSAMSTHAPFIVEVEGGPKYAHGCACTHTNTHTHTHTHSFYLASAHKGHMDTEILFPTTLERSSHMALLTSTIKRTSPQVDRKEVIKTD